MKGIIWLLLKSRWKVSICFQCDRFVRRTAIKKKEKERINAFIWIINEWTYISLGIICYPMSTAFLKLRSSKIIRFSEQIMSMAKYPRIISRQTEANVHLYELPRKKVYCCKKCDQFTFPSATDGCCPFSHPGACVPHMFLFGDDSGIFEPAAPVKRYHASSMLLSHAALPIP